MKNVLFLLLLLSFQVQAQIKGNGNIVTKSFPIEQVKQLEINLNARIILDFKADDQISITVDENLIDQIDFRVSQGYMNLQQKEWIEPSNSLRVSIGAAGLRKLINDAHSSTSLLHMQMDDFHLIADIGTIDLQGRVSHLVIDNKSAKIEALDFEASYAEVKIRSWGSVFLNVSDTLNTSIGDKGRLKIIGTPKVLMGNAEAILANTNKQIRTDTRYINLRIKNNSWTRKSFVVVGPKKDGTSFSYGFSLMPGATRSERWTIGSEVFRVRNGQQQLLAKIEAKDENQLVKLFQ
ncbi:MAG: DUF2807 domain-containing protein [Saprospiraceae bacterium]|nr:DUF2807 domain-containing protein [Saprospiraceae bacterium]